MLKNLILITLIFCLPSQLFSDEPLIKQIKIPYDTTILKQLSKLGLSVEYISPQGHITTTVSDMQLFKLDEMEIAYHIIIEDLLEFYESRNKGKQPEEVFQQSKRDAGVVIPEDFTLGTMGGFFTYDELYSHLDNMNQKYPDLISQKTAISSDLSFEGNPVYYLKISDNPNINEEEPEVLYTALTHSREPISMQQMVFYMYYLLENYTSDSTVRYLVDNTQMYFIPCLNPDGYLYNEQISASGGGLWRKNRRDNNDGTFGVDLNRNFPYKWGYNNLGSSPLTESLTYRGPEAASEAETQMIQDFCMQHNFLLTLNYHSYGNCLLYPWGFFQFYTNPEENIVFISC